MSRLKEEGCPHRNPVSGRPKWLEYRGGPGEMPSQKDCTFCERVNYACFVDRYMNTPLWTTQDEHVKNLYAITIHVSVPPRTDPVIQFRYISHHASEQSSTHKVSFMPTHPSLLPKSSIVLSFMDVGRILKSQGNLRYSYS